MSSRAAERFVKTIQDEEAREAREARAREEAGRPAMERERQRLHHLRQRQLKYDVLRDDCYRHDIVTVCTIVAVWAGLPLSVLAGQYVSPMFYVGTLIGVGLAFLTPCFLCNLYILGQNRRKALAAAAKGEQALEELDDLQEANVYPRC